MSKSNKEVRVGQIVEVHPNNIYKIDDFNGNIIKGYLAGRLKRARLSIIIGDEVKYEVDEYGNNNRITRRL